ncbi:MAG: excalibur calcium-binding domain-containing protein, partial [Nanoarchaeota archaeon]
LLREIQYQDMMYDQYEYEDLYGADYDSSEDPNNLFDCADFDTHAEAQKVFESSGGPSYDPHHLDRDGDGYACEALP